MTNRVRKKLQRNMQNRARTETIKEHKERLRNGMEKKGTSKGTQKIFNKSTMVMIHHGEIVAENAK